MPSSAFPLLTERLEDLEPEILLLELVLVTDSEELFDEEDGEGLDEEILTELFEREEEELD